MTLFIGTIASHAGTIVTSKDGKTITLTDYKTDEPLVLTQDTTIVLNGSNSITLPNGTGASAIYTPDGYYSVKLTGNGSLTANGMISAYEIDINGCSITVDVGEESVPAIYAFIMRISNAKVKANGNFIISVGCSFDPDDESLIEVTNGSDFTVTGGLYGLISNKIVIDNSSVNVCPLLEYMDPETGSMNPVESCGIITTDLTVRNNSTVKTKAYTLGMEVGSALIDHSYVSIETADPQAIAAISIYDKLTVTSATITTPAGGKIIDFTPSYANPDSSETYKTISGSDGKPAAKVVIEPDHKWDAGKVTKAPTMTAAGVKTYTCSVCKATKTEAIPKLSSPDNFAPGADASVAEACILALPDDKDPAGSAFGLLQLKATKTTKSSIKLTWKKVKGAKKYIIYSNACGKGKKYQKLTTVTGKSYTAKKVAGKKLTKGKYYKFLMVAVDGSNKVVSTSKTVHAATAGGKVGNDKKVTTKAKKNKVTVKVKKTFKLGAKTVAASKKLKVKKHRAVSYESSNTAIATVSAKGVIKGVKKGSCKVYA